MSEALTLRALRRELKLTLAQLGERIGVRSIGHLSDIENGAPCSVKVAVAIELLSEGRIPAATLSSDVALVDAMRANAEYVGGDHGDPAIDVAARHHG